MSRLCARIAILICALSTPALAQEPPTGTVPAGCVVSCGPLAQRTVRCDSVLVTAPRYEALVDGTLAAEGCLPSLHSALERGDDLDAALQRQERLTRRARLQRNMALGVLGGVGLALVVVVAMD